MYHVKISENENGHRLFTLCHFDVLYQLTLLFLCSGRLTNHVELKTVEKKWCDLQTIKFV